jgi:hypothetical protein
VDPNHEHPDFRLKTTDPTIVSSFVLERRRQAIQVVVDYLERDRSIPPRGIFSR